MSNELAKLVLRNAILKSLETLSIETVVNIVKEYVDAEKKIRELFKQADSQKKLKELSDQFVKDMVAPFEKIIREEIK
jgi:hypothetical protein